VGGNAGEDIFEPGEGVDTGPLARSHETPQHGSCVTAVVAAKEHPVVPADSHTADGALGSVMPTPELCRVHWILKVPQGFKMVADAA
jgi:hypothetical protein